MSKYVDVIDFKSRTFLGVEIYIEENGELAVRFKFESELVSKCRWG